MATELLLCGIHWVFSALDPAMGRLFAQSEMLPCCGIQPGVFVSICSSGLAVRHRDTGAHVGAFKRHHEDDLARDGANHYYIVHGSCEGNLPRARSHGPFSLKKVCTLAKLTSPPFTRQVQLTLLRSATIVVLLAT